MMTIAALYMFLTAFCATLLYVILKYFARYDINNLHALTCNYLTAAICSFFLNMTQNITALPALNVILLPALGMGLLFIIVFYITAVTAERHGIAVTSIAGKMSMVIPITAGVILYNESLTILKIIGVFLALLALYISNYKKDKPGKFQLIIFPALLFLGSGLVDTAVKISQYYVINDENRHLYIACCFGFAGIFGMSASIYQTWKRRISIHRKSIAAGIILGTVNYLSLDFLIHSLSLPGIESSSAFAMINMMVVILSGLFAFLLFRESPNKSNISGIIIAIAAIAMLSL